MGVRKRDDKRSIAELQAVLYRKKHAQRRERLRRLKDAGRVVEVAGRPAPDAAPPLERPRARPTGPLQPHALAAEETPPAAPEQRHQIPLLGGIQWRWIANKLLLFVEIGAILSFLWLVVGLWDTQRELNQELAVIQREEAAALALPTPTATPVIDVVVLPGGHKPPVEGRAPESGEAGYIPAHLLPAVNAYQAPPLPTPGPEQARRVQIPAIDVDSSIYQGQGWEQLKKGVGQYVGSPPPGSTGNLVLAAHNDIYGEIFRYLDQLERGDEVIISTERQQYTYIIRETVVVEPTEVWVMEPTEHASVTLISCYPYRIDNKRIVVFADLATTAMP
ncbi:MAG: class D sortase [Candidatus Promineifilaceae bacterium]|nr:class D sortase [Candidatus Promineifilaceae bacterium]